jgi:hypothetical protein
MKNIILIVFIGINLFICFDACETIEEREYENGIKIVKYRLKISFHELGRTKEKLYYKGKKLCSDIGFYVLSPDSRFLLYTNEVKYNRERIEIYDISKDRKYIFKYIFYSRHLLNLMKPDIIKWNEKKIEIIFGKNQTILHLGTKLLEINNCIWKKRYFDYLLIQLDQLYENISLKDRKRNRELIKPYLGVRIDNRLFVSEKEISIESWEKIGNVFYTLINDLKEKYSADLAFQIFKRAFDEHFKVLEGKVIFVWK